MPLNPSGLSSDLETLAAGPPDTFAECAQEWADAMQSYATAIVPASTTVAAAAATLIGALTSAFQSGAAAAPMETAFTAFATTVGAGMAPTWIATPPPGPIGFAALMTPPYPETHAEGASNFSSAIDTWMRTGTATPSGGGSPVFWS